MNKSQLKKLVIECIKEVNEVSGFSLKTSTKKQIIEFVKGNFAEAKKIKGGGIIVKERNGDISFYGQTTCFAKFNKNDKLYINDTSYGNVSETFLNYFRKVAKKLGVKYIELPLDE